MPAGQVSIRGSLTCSASYVLEPMLHPVNVNIFGVLGPYCLSLGASEGFEDLS